MLNFADFEGGNKVDTWEMQQRTLLIYCATDAVPDKLASLLKKNAAITRNA